MTEDIQDDDIENLELAAEDVPEDEAWPDMDDDEASEEGAAGSTGSPTGIGPRITVGSRPHKKKRKRYKKTLRMKAGRRKFFDADRCRKIYWRCLKGDLTYEITGKRAVSGDIKKGSVGGPSGGGGARDYGNMTLTLVAETDSEIYLHIEWITGGLAITDPIDG